MANPDEEKETLYHYTDEDGLKGIASSGVIYGSRGDSKADDAVYGDGTYLTSIPPEVGKYAVAENNWDGEPRDVDEAIDSGKADYYVEVTVDKRDVEKVENDEGRDIYLYRGDLNITEKMDPDFGEVPDY